MLFIVDEIQFSFSSIDEFEGWVDSWGPVFAPRDHVSLRRYVCERIERVSFRLTGLECKVHIMSDCFAVSEACRRYAVQPEVSEARGVLLCRGGGGSWRCEASSFRPQRNTVRPGPRSTGRRQVAPTGSRVSKHSTRITVTPVVILRFEAQLTYK